MNALSPQTPYRLPSMWDDFSQASTPQVGGINLFQSPGDTLMPGLSATSVAGGQSNGWGGFSGMLDNIMGSALPKESLVNGVAQKSGGWLSPALGIAQGIGSLVMGSKQYKLAKEGLAQSQNQFNQNYAAQRQTTNTALEDRQRARVAAGGDAYESVDSYMARNGIR